MTSSQKWEFKKLGPQDQEAEINIDELLGNDIYTIGSEACQNSLDATIDHDENPTLIRFAYKELENNEFFLKYINNLIPKLNCMGSLKNQLSNDEKSNPDFLIIEDFNTTGLTGADNFKDNIDAEQRDEMSNFMGFFGKIGVSTKKDKGKLGSKGIGSTSNGMNSKIRSYFGYTIRQDDRRELLQGICLGKTHFFEQDKYDWIGRYAKFNEINGSEQLDPYPIDDPVTIGEFKDNLNLKRKDQSGLSIIIPYPKDDIKNNRSKLIKHLIGNFYPVIIQGKLKIDLENLMEGFSEIVTKENLYEVFNNPNLNLGSKVREAKFVERCFEINEYTLTLRDNCYRDEVLDEADFKPEDLEIAYKKFDNGELIKIKVPIQYTLKNSDQKEKKTFFDVYVQKTIDNQEGKAIYLRKYLPLYNEASRYQGPCNIFIHFNEDDIASFVASAENTSHDKIDERQNEMESRFKPPYRQQIKFIKKIPYNLSDLLTKANVDENTSSFSEIFKWPEDNGISNNQGKLVLDPHGGEEISQSTEDEESENKQKDKIIDDPPIIPRTPDMFIFSLKTGGFTVSINEHFENIESKLPFTINLVLAYDEEGKVNSLSSFDDDFNLFDNENFIFKKHNSEYQVLDKNRIQVSFNAPNSKLSVEGFWKDFDLIAKGEVIGS